MIKVDTWDQLFKVIEDDLFDIMDSMNQNDGFNDSNPVTVMKQKIDETVYHKDLAFTPKWYEPTFELRDSVEATQATKLGNMIEVTVKHNPSKIQANGWTHGGNSSANMSELLPEIMNDSSRWGWIDGMFPKDPEKAKWRFDRPYLELTVRDLTNFKFKKWIKQELIKKGYRVI